MPGKTVTVTLEGEGSICYVPVPFDPKAELGRVRAPVRVTLNGYTYRSTIASMGGIVGIPLRKSHREAAAVEAGQTLEVRIELDTAAREVEPPPDLIEALRTAPPAWERWRDLSYTHRREHVEAIEEAKKPETRARRIAKAVEAVAARPAKRQH